jgi:hypothetical protein
MSLSILHALNCDCHFPRSCPRSPYAMLHYSRSTLLLHSPFSVLCVLRTTCSTLHPRSNSSLCTLHSRSESFCTLHSHSKSSLSTHSFLYSMHHIASSTPFPLSCGFLQSYS